LEKGRDHKRRVVEISELVEVRDGEYVLNSLYQEQDGLKKVGELQGRKI